MKRQTTLLLACISALFMQSFSASGKAAPPPAQFNASTYSGCAPLTVTFYNSSIGNGNYTWNFGDPSSGIYNTSIACSPTHTFVNAGVYTVTMTYYYNFNIYTATATITVWPRPNPVIAGVDTVCAGATQVYTATGLPGSNFYWTINGGSILGANNSNTVTVKWTMPGTGLLTVQETTIHGCTNNTAFKVLVANQPIIGDYCDLGRGSAGNNPDGKDHKTCLCAYNVEVLHAIDNFSQIFSPAIYNFQWTVISGGSIQSGGNTNIVHILVGGGPTITVKLVVWNDFGCSDTQICIFDVCPSPTASFKADTACFTGTTHFDASGSTIQSQITTYNWQFGDFSQAVTNSPINTTTHTYGAPNTYNVTLTVKNKGGCTDDTTIKVLVNAGTPPPIDCPGTVCHGTLHCYHTPYYAGATYIWTVTGGVGTPSVKGDSICVLWGNGPKGNISLHVIGGPYTCGFNSIDIPVFPLKVKISGPDTVCSGSTVQFSVPLIPGSCYSWLPSNPNISLANNPGNIININIPVGATGTFTIYADVRNDITCCSGKDTFKFVIQPAIVIDTIQSACEHSTKTYTSNFPVTWNVTGGVIVTSTTTSITITWGNAGTGVIMATAINPNLVCNNVVSGQIILNPLPPNPPINGPTIVCKGSIVTYNYVTDPNITSSVWSISPSIIHTPAANTDVVKFNVPGNYVITVNYYNTNYNNVGPYSCNSSSQINVLVVDTACMGITGPAAACMGSTFTYTIPSNPGGIWQWNVIGGQVISQTLTSITIQWGNINQGQVTIQNTLCNGFCKKLVAISGFPAGIITLGDSTCKGDSIRLYAPPGFSYVWNTAATTQSIKVTTTGLYSVVVSQLTSPFCAITISKNINPIPRRPKPKVYLTYHCMVAPNTPIPYEMIATYNPSWTYAWSPQTAIPANSDTTYLHYSTVQNSTHQVIVTNQYGCKDTNSVKLTAACLDTIICNNPPCGGTGCSCKTTFTFTYDPCTGQFTYIFLTGTPFTAMYWNFGDGDYSNLMNPQHWFSTLGNQTISVSGWCGCNWVSLPVASSIIYVPYILRPKITHSFPTACNYNLVTLSKVPSATILSNFALSHTINWGDGNFTFAALPQNHTYASAGTYYVSYTVSTSPPFCSKTVYDTIVILPFKADFGFCDSGCINQSIQFVDHSTSWSPIVSWLWNFGDATTSNIQSPFHIYAAVGTYTVKLTITNQQGCVTSVSYVVHTTTFNPGVLTYTVNGVAAAGPTFSICEGGNVVATAPFSVNYTYAWNDGHFGNKDTIKKSGIYWVMVTNPHGCVNKLGPFTVIVNPNPNATILMADSICSSFSLNLLALNGLGYTFAWLVNPGALTATGNPASVTGPPPGNYNAYLTVTNNFGCIAKDTALVHWLAGPNITVTPPSATLCEGQTINLTATIVGPYTALKWSPGQITNTITVYSTGIYTATATNAFGCSNSASSYVTVNPKPDLSNIPRGCYKVCKNEIGIAKVCGPFPLVSLGQAFTYDWRLNGVTIATTQNITLNAAGNYQLIVLNTNTGCADTSKIFNVQFVPGTIVIIVVSSPHPVICNGSQDEIIMDVQNPVAGVTYTWYMNGVATEVGTHFVTNVAGMVVLEGGISKCCVTYDTVVIDTGNCCFNIKDTTFHLIQDSTVYTTNTWWDGKYYVAGRVFVRNKAVLDMTTIDVVFDRDGEIIFEDSSTIRANNSVFRPCDMHDVWVGFTFKNKSSGFIHTNTFKNAKHAIDVLTTGPEGVKITDNVFTDCNIGVRIDRGGKTYNQGITHNSFVIDNYDFTTKGLYSTFDYFGVILRSVKMEELVSQNDFRNSDKSSQSNRYFGIYGLRSSANLSENMFSDMHRSIDYTSNVGLLNIENNKIEKTFQGKFPSDVQIRVTDCDQPVLIYANELRNSDNQYAKTVGIFAERTTSLNIRDNNIKGFDVGIWTRRTTNSVVNENDIDLSGDIGILDSFSRNIDINCNIVRLKDCKKVPGTSCNSVGIFMQAGNASNDIFTNCVFDTRRAIYLLSNGVNVPVPNVINNYLYNYLSAGIQIVNHLGSVGNAVQPGRNTFVSNNYAGGAYDIFAIPFGTIAERCNYGIIANFQVSSSPCVNGTMNSSTAACGHQMNNAKYYKLDQWDICDNYTGDKSHIIGIDLSGKDILINTNVLQAALVVKMDKKEIDQITAVLISKNDKTSFDFWMAKLSAEKALNSFETELSKAKWQFANESKQNAVSSLMASTPSTTEEWQLKMVLLADWQRQPGDIFDISTLQNLNAIDQSHSSIAPIARDLLHANAANHDYIFGSYEIEAPFTNVPASANYFVHVIPNPATNLVNISFSIEGTSDAVITLYDVLGNKIETSTIKISEGMYQMDLSKVAKGIYLVNVFDKEKQKNHVAKLLKQ